MSYTINTNVTSLQAQEYLRINADFYSKTINRVTSGLRIISSGDDAAGLAIANAIRSDRAVLTQGVRNANDGLSTLQTIDGGINNISKLLDRARTLAAQSASGTFTGDRNVVNSEFQSVIAEINRQAQVIGLDRGGLFARTFSVFIGGGRSNAGIDAITNGSVSVDLSQSTVDAKSLGLSGVQAAGVAGTDIGSGSATTSVQQIVNDSTNVSSLAVAGYTDFYFRGPGFSDNDAVKVSVSINGVADTDTLVANINSAIEAAGNGGTQAAAAFKAANIRATIVTDSDGKQRLAFNSSDAAFQVAAGDRMANALMGNFSAGATGHALTHTVTSGTAAAADATVFNATSDQKVIVRFSGASLASPVDIELNITAGSTTVGQAITDLSNQIASNTALQAAGITLDTHASGTALSFTSKRGEIFEVEVSGDTANRLGLGTWRALDPVTGGFDYTSITGSGATFAAGTTQTLEFSIAGGTKQSVTINAGEATTAAQAVAYLNNAFMSNSVLRAAGLVASVSGGEIKIDSTNGTYFRINALSGGTNELGFGASGTASAAGYSSTITTKHTFNAGGSAVTALGSSDDVFSFQAIRNGGDDQTVTISATDANGAQHSLAVVLRNDSSVRNATSIDDALDAINSALQQSNDTTLRRIVAVKEINAAGTAEGIRFLSDLPSFKVSIGTNTGGVGLRDDASGGPNQGIVVESEVSAGGSNVAVDTQSGAEAAVSALARAVEILGQAQAVVGKGQNQFNFAISLAQTQLNNLAASESRIRDADLAAEAANLTKAQILQQAGIAALAQANVAPQAVLSLLRG